VLWSVQRFSSSRFDCVRISRHWYTAVYEHHILCATVYDLASKLAAWCGFSRLVVGLKYQHSLNTALLISARIMMLYKP
jgi:hypothetical protein